MRATMGVAGCAGDFNWSAGDVVEQDFEIVRQLLAVGLATADDDEAAAFAPGGAKHSTVGNPFIPAAVERGTYTPEE